MMQTSSTGTWKTRVATRHPSHPPPQILAKSENIAPLTMHEMRMRTFRNASSSLDNCIVKEDLHHLIVPFAPLQSDFLLTCCRRNKRVSVFTSTQLQSTVPLESPSFVDETESNKKKNK